MPRIALRLARRLSRCPPQRRTAAHTPWAIAGALAIAVTLGSLAAQAQPPQPTSPAGEAQAPTPSTDWEVDSWRTLHALREAAHAQPTVVIPQLARALGASADSKIRERAVIAMGALGSSATLPLLEVLKSADPVQRRNAAVVLARVGDTRAVAALLSLADDPDDGVRAVATSAVQEVPAAARDEAAAWIRSAERHLTETPTDADAGPLWEWQQGGLVAIDVPPRVRSARLAQRAATAALRADPASTAALAIRSRARSAEAEILESGAADDPAAQERAAKLRLQLAAANPDHPRPRSAATDQTKTAAVAITAPVPTGDAPVRLRLARGGQILLHLAGPAYRTLQSARVVQGNRTSTVSSEVTARLGPYVRGGRELLLQASSRAPIAPYYRVEGLERSLVHTLLPITFEVTASHTSPYAAPPRDSDILRLEPTALRLTRPRLAFVKPVQSMGAYLRDPMGNLPTDPLLVAALSGNTPGLAFTAPSTIFGSMDFQLQPNDTPWPWVNRVIPESLAKVGGTVELRGEDLPCPANGEQARVYLGGLLLYIVSSSPDRIVAQLPNYQISGKLRVVRERDQAGVTADADYHVSVFEPYDYFDANATTYSKANAYLLALAAQRVYVDRNTDNTATETPAQYSERLHAQFHAWGMSVRAVIDERNGFVLSALRSDTQGVVMRNDHVLIIALAGTQTINLGDAFTDAQAVPVRKMQLGNTWVHGGFWAGQEAMLPTGKAVFQTIEGHAQQALSSGRRIWITGHSLGGAMASIVAMRLQSRGLPVQGIMTFGEPKAGLQDFATLFGAAFNSPPNYRAWRVVSHGDPVPSFPRLAPLYAHGARLALFGTSGTNVQLSPNTVAQDYALTSTGLNVDHLEYWQRTECDFRVNTTLGGTFALWPVVDPNAFGN